MKKKNIILFFVFLLICSLEQGFNYFQLIKGEQPKRVNLPTIYLELSPTALVFDRIVNFVPSNHVILTFEDGTQKVFHYNEREERNLNSLEMLLQRKSFTLLASRKMIFYYFCGHNIKSMGPLPDKKITAVDVLILEKNHFNHYVCNDLKT